MACRPYFVIFPTRSRNWRVAAGSCACPPIAYISLSSADSGIRESLVFFSLLSCFTMCFPEGRGQSSKRRERKRRRRKNGTQRRCRHRSFDEAPFFFHLNFCFLYILLSQTAKIFIKSKRKKNKKKNKSDNLKEKSLYCADQRPQEGALRYVK